MCSIGTTWIRLLSLPKQKHNKNVLNKTLNFYCIPCNRVTWNKLVNCIKVTMIRLILVVIALLGLCVLLGTKSGRKLKFYHHLTSVSLLCKNRIKHTWMNILVALPKLVFMWRVMVVIIKNRLIMTLVRITWRLAFTRL